MAKVVENPSEIEQAPVPVEDDELGPEVIKELKRRVERWRRGEGTWIAHEDLIRQLDAERGISDD